MREIKEMTNPRRLLAQEVRSTNGCTMDQKSCVRGLGLRKIRHTVSSAIFSCNVLGSRPPFLEAKRGEEGFSFSPFPSLKFR
ncbi:uL30 family ribosomal protein [Pseudoteredinibacter isoporae]|uniref:uL30 family ribosomal protein n=1 Tax=Pseudoteredinibacter isoporae TaxID=570281 RepID=UPI003342BD53